jgi:hypothetical protein
VKLKPANPTMGVLIFFSALLLLSVLILLADHGRTIKRDQYRTGLAERLLEDLAARTSLRASGTDACLQVTYTLGKDRSSLCGRVFSLQWDHQNSTEMQVETHLEYSLELVKVTSRDPAQPSRSMLRLLRDDAASDLSLPGEGVLLTVSIDCGDQQVSLDNRENSAGVAYGPAWFGRQEIPAIPDLGWRHDPSLPTVLRRAVRGHICDQLASTETECHDASVVIYPDAGSRSYWIDLRVLGSDLGKVRAHLTLDSDLVGGQLKLVKGASNLEPQANLYLVPPRPFGELLTPDDPGFRLIHYQARKPLHKTVQIDLDELLAGTSWLEEPP